MSKYESLWHHLEKDRREHFRMSFDDKASVLGFDFQSTTRFLTIKRKPKPSATPSAKYRSKNNLLFSKK